MEEVGFLIAWAAALMIWHLVLAGPGLVFVWRLRGRDDAKAPAVRAVAALIAGVWLTPTLLGGHFPLILPLILTYLGSAWLGVPFLSWNLAPVVAVALAVLVLWPMRSNLTPHPDARDVPPSANAGSARADGRGR